MLKVGLKFVENDERRVLIAEALRLLLEEFGEGLLSVVVFGSVARGEETLASDMDLLVISRDFPESMSGRMDRLARMLTRLEKTEAFEKMREEGVNTWIQFHALKPEEAKRHRPIYLDVVEDGVIIFDREKFIETVLLGLGERLKELGARRVFLEDGSWYWDLKPNIIKGEKIEL